MKDIEYAYRTREDAKGKIDFRYSIVNKKGQLSILTEYNKYGTGWKYSSMTEIICDADRQVVNNLFGKQILLLGMDA